MRKNFVSNLIKKLSSVVTVPFTEVGEFIQVFFSYITHKIDWLIVLVRSITTKGIALTGFIRFFAISRLIFSHGKYGNKIRDFSVIGIAVLIFILSGFFQNDLVTEATGSDVDFISSNSNTLLTGYISVTTQSGEKTLLDKPIEHIVQEGETLQSIGQKYGISFDSIQFANGLSSSRVKAGQKLLIPSVEGTLHKVVKGDTVEKLAKRYSVPSQAIVDFNYLDAPYTLTAGTVLTIPNAKKPVAGQYYSGNAKYGLSAYGVLPHVGNVEHGTGQFAWPFSGVLTQGYHQYHHAIDIAANTGNIKAADKGTVIRAGWWEGGYGNAVQIDHGNGYVTTYAHMSVLAVSVGDNVEKGQKIGVVGSTGRSTGPHVHFVIQKDGVAVNPLNYLP